MSPDVSLKTTTSPSISAIFFSHFFSCHVHAQKWSKETACLKRGQLPMAENSKHDNNLSCLTVIVKASCLALSRCGPRGRLQMAKHSRSQSILVKDYKILPMIERIQ